MFKLFKHTPKKTEPAVAVGEAQPVPTADAPLIPAATKPADTEAGSVTRWPYPVRIEEYRQDGTLVVQAELPGMEPDKDVRVTVVDGRLAIEAERREEDEVEGDGFILRELHYGTFSRSLPLPAGVAASSITATYKDGILEVRIPAGAGTSSPPVTRIPITAG